MNFRIKINGIVQGVGFRPFIFRLANKHNLKGRVFNDLEGVIIEVSANQNQFNNFLSEIKSQYPPNAVINNINTQQIEQSFKKDFLVEDSLFSQGNKNALISPDIAICKDCEKEMSDNKDRRFNYPFINCTNCGPRFTIVKDIPYDRENTTMYEFKMCANCSFEYKMPGDRRFYAEPIACRECGPQVSVYDNENKLINTTNPIKYTAEKIKQGSVAAVKGLGGYHLACDAKNYEAVQKIREGKKRPLKAFAIMVNDIEQVKQLCIVSKKEEEALKSNIAPIVLLEIKRDNLVAKNIAYRNNYLGVMLAYTPLHKILLQETETPLLMTSANIINQPIIYKPNEAFEKLKFVNLFLEHNREIYNHCDDSVVFCLQDKVIPIRRSRGYVPYPVELPFDLDKQMFAAGAQEKNVFALSKKRNVFLSQHIGQLDDYDVYNMYEETIERCKKLFDINPEIIVCDKHPNYASTMYALKVLPPLKKGGGGGFIEPQPILIQHHKAHIASCMADNKIPLDRKIIGVALDGTGLGDDGNIWGGEFFVGSYKNMKRVGHLEYIPMPGGEKAINQPWRMAYSYLYHAFGNSLYKSPLTPLFQRGEQEGIHELLQKNINLPLTSSMGRLFDGVSALLGICEKIEYQAQAAIELEMLAAKNIEKSYEVNIINNDMFIIEVKGIIKQIVGDLENNINKRIISAKFHNTVADIILQLVNKIRDRSNITTVVLSGGVFQNRYLLEKAYNLLYNKNFRVLVHRQVPCNDAGICLGQIAIAGASLS